MVKILSLREVGGESMGTRIILKLLWNPTIISHEMVFPIPLETSRNVTFFTQHHPCVFWFTFQTALTVPSVVLILVVKQRGSTRITPIIKMENHGVGFKKPICPFSTIKVFLFTKCCDVKSPMCSWCTVGNLHTGTGSWYTAGDLPAGKEEPLGEPTSVSTWPPNFQAYEKGTITPFRSQRAWGPAF